MRGFFLRLSLFLITTAIILTVAELFLRKYKPQITFSEAMKYSDDCLSSDPYIPFTLRKNFTCGLRNYYGDFDVTASLNSLGYRQGEFNKDRSGGSKRVLILGDSFTFGVGVKDGETYPAVLSALLKDRGAGNTEVINAGYADGFSPDSYYLYLKNKGMALKPDVIVMGFFVWNDITDLSETVWEKTDSQGLPEKIVSCCRVVDNGILRNKEIEFKYKYPILRESNLFLSTVESLKPKFTFLQPPKTDTAKRDLWQGCIFIPSCLDSQFPAEQEKTFKVLKAIKKMADENHAFFLVALIPVDVQLYPDAGFKYGSLQYPEASDKEFIQHRIESKLDNDNISYTDLYPIFDSQRSRGNPFFTHDAHFNQLGNRIAAEAISDYLLTHVSFK